MSSVSEVTVVPEKTIDILQTIAVSHPVLDVSDGREQFSPLWDRIRVLIVEIRNIKIYHDVCNAGGLVILILMNWYEPELSKNTIS